MQFWELEMSRNTARDFLAGKLAALPGTRPTFEDWADHLTTLFPDVRLKRFLETRGADAGSFAQLWALPALWAGLLYDQVGYESRMHLAATAGVLGWLAIAHFAFAMVRAVRAEKSTQAMLRGIAERHGRV